MFEGREFIMSVRKSNEQFEDELNKKNTEVINLEPYKGARTKIQFQCKKCGYSWYTTPDSVLRGSGCARCAGILKKTQSDFVEEIKNVNPKIEVIGEYVNNKTRVKCSSRVCGHIWDADPAYLRTGVNCPNCVHSGTSFVEQCIFMMFEDCFGKGKVVNRNKSAIGKEIDVFIPDRRIAIEYGSWFWHKTKQTQDIAKIEACLEQNIDIIVVFDSFDGPSFPSKYRKNFITYSVNLSDNESMLRKMLEELLGRIGIVKTITKEEFSDIKKRAYERCSRRSTAMFQKEVSFVNPNIQIVGEYTAARKKVKCSCTICGYTWTPFADNLLRGQGCPNCAKIRQAQKKTISHEMFMKRVQSKLNPNVELIGEYKKTSKKIKCRCKQCGFEWKALPADLRHGSGCPKCGGTMKKTHKEFLREISILNSDIEIIGTYSSNNIPIECKCKKCGYQWFPRPKHLLKGHGCPRCNGNLKKTKQNIIDEIDKKGFAISVLGEYSNCEKPMLFKCKECGYEWEQIPKNIFHSRGCPHCNPYTEKQDAKWNEFYEYALAYYEEFGALDIPVRAEYCGVKLGQWVESQRRAYRNTFLPDDKKNKSIGKISEKRIELLNQIGMKW